MDNLTELFCLIDDFCRAFEPAFEQQLLADGQKKRRRSTEWSLSELMTLTVLFHPLRYRQFKAFYLGYVCRHLRSEFLKLPSYSRCVALLPRCIAPLTALFETLRGACDGISTVIDELKNLCPIEHTRHRSVSNFLVNLMAGIVAYCLSDTKPSLNLTKVNLLPQM